jgi:hypothetical protein
MLASCEGPSVARTVLPALAGRLNGGLTPSASLRWVYVTLGGGSLRLCRLLWLGALRPDCRGTLRAKTARAARPQKVGNVPMRGGQVGVTRLPGGASCQRLRTRVSPISDTQCAHAAWWRPPDAHRLHFSATGDGCNVQPRVNPDKPLATAPTDWRDRSAALTALQ